MPSRNYRSSDIDDAMNTVKSLPIKKIVGGIFISIIVLIILFSLNNLFETVQKGTYHIIQRPFSGKVEAKLQPGMYFQGFSDVKEWPFSETFYFTKDMDEGARRNQAIEVRFNDGSKCEISGTCRVMLPRTEEECKRLMTENNFKNYEDVEMRLLLPTIRNALRNAANLMTARESYADKRLDYISWSWDQIQLGLYQTETTNDKIEDPITGAVVYRDVKRVMKDENGKPLRTEISPLENTGITLSNFEIKVFEYEPKVVEQISQQQESLMAIATARAKSERAEQEAKTAEAEGKKSVMEAKYKKEVEKEEATVEANKEKEVAEIKAEQEKAVAALMKERAEIEAEQKLAVATLDQQAAEQEKLADIARGEGKAEAQKLAMAADGALEKKLQAWVQAQESWAKAYSSRQVPVVNFSGGSEGGTDQNTPEFMDLLKGKFALDLALDMGLPKTNNVQARPTTRVPVPTQ